MPVAPFLEQIPESFRKDPIMYRFIENLYTRFNQQIVESNRIEQDLALVAQQSTDGGGSGVVFANPEEFTEVRVETVEVDAVTETFYFASGNFQRQSIIRLPQFPEENFYIRAQVFDNKSFVFIVELSAKTINDNDSVLLTGNGNLVDIKYSLEQDRYILT